MRMSFRVIVSFSVLLFGLLLWTRNVEQAYMQSKILCVICFTEPPPEADLTMKYIIKIVFPHYGLM